MKHLKALSLAAVAAASLTVWVGAGTASATVVDCTGGACPTDEVIHAVAEGLIVLHTPPSDIECGESTIQGTLTNPGSSTTTASGPVTSLSFARCNAEVVTLENGSFEIHTKTASPDNNGTLTSTGARITTVIVGFHCIYSTSGTDLGTLTGSATTGANATLDIEATLPRTGGRSGAFCGSTGLLTGAYHITTPTGLNIT